MNELPGMWDAVMFECGGCGFRVNMAAQGHIATYTLGACVRCGNINWKYLFDISCSRIGVREGVNVSPTHDSI